MDAYGSEAPVTPTIFELFRKEHALPPEEAWVIATNKSFGLMGGSKLRAFGDPYSANVVLPKQLLIETIKSAVSTETGPGVEDRQALAERMMLALDEGYEGFGWKVFESGRTLGAELKKSLAKSLLDYFNDPTVPTSGDELTFFMTKEIMNRLAPSLLVVNFWDIDIAHYGAYSLYLEAIRRTDRLVHELWQHAQSSPQYRDRTTLLVVPELGRDGDVVGNGFANHRSGDESCRRVWLVAVGAGVPKGAGTERPIRTTDVAPTVARHSRVQDAGVRRQAARGTGVLDVRVLRACNSTHGLTGDAAALARAHEEVLGRLPATVHAFILVELQKWPTLFAAEQRYQRALLDAPLAIAERRPAAGRRRDRARRGGSRRRQARRRRSRALSGRSAGAAAEAPAPAGVAEGSRRLLPAGRSRARGRSSIPPDAPRRLVVQIYGSGIAIQAGQAVEPLQGDRRPRAAEARRRAQASERFLRALFGGRDRRRGTRRRC